MSVNSDFTERKKIEDALRKSNDLLSAIFNNAGFGIAIGDMEGRVVESNPSLEHILGYNKNELHLKCFSEFTHPDDVMNEWKLIEEVLTGKSNYYEIEKRYIRKDNTVIWVRLIGSLTTDPDGKPLNGIAIIEDITERKKIQDELKKSHDNLELKVQERTAELDILIDELTRSNKELQQFAYVSSHDLQEPLRTIASFTQLLERRYKSKLDSDADEFMDYIVDAAKRMQQLINDLLQYSRVTTQGKEFQLVNVNEVLDKVLSNLKTLIDENNAEINVDKLPTVMADDSQLIQLFQNIIGNAINFKTPEEPPKINISCRKDE